ncbi:MAG: hypothetical protein ABFS30_12940 [Pseudomonadota bacterium]
MKAVVRALLIAFVIGAAGQVMTAHDADARFRVGNWTGNAFYSKGRFSHCRIWVGYRSGITLNFAQFASYNLFIGLSRPNWNLVPNGRYQMTMIIDGRVVRSARGIVLNSNRTRLWLPLGRDTHARDRLRRGFRLTLTNGRQRYKFDLTATSAALARLQQCVQFQG